jgi:hypothetical protein
MMTSNTLLSGGTSENTIVTALGDNIGSLAGGLEINGQRWKAVQNARVSGNG